MHANDAFDSIAAPEPWGRWADCKIPISQTHCTEARW